MKTTYEIQKLWGVIGEIGHAAVTSEDERLGKLYEILSEALDYAEIVGLIEYEEENEQ
jgi:hypothetical protein